MTGRCKITAAFKDEGTSAVGDERRGCPLWSDLVAMPDPQVSGWETPLLIDDYMGLY